MSRARKSAMLAGRLPRILAVLPPISSTHGFGQSCLLARRLVEAGVCFVTTVNGPSIIWDTHKDNFKGLKDRLVPPMEQAFVALLDDLRDRGALD